MACLLNFTLSKRGKLGNSFRANMTQSSLNKGFRIKDGLDWPLFKIFLVYTVG